MDEQETANANNDQAARWIARMDRQGLDERDQTELDAWLAADPRRAGALLRAEAAWSMLDRASVLAAPDRTPTPRVGARLPRRKVLAGGAGLAASIAGGAVAFGAWRETRPTIVTARGEIRRVPLEDGSLAVVNTDTRVRVDLQPRLRGVRLARGEAWFQVVRDPKRPFVVAAGDLRVRAVGTAFSVRRHADGAEVLVTEGVVEAWSSGADLTAVRLGAGERGVFRSAAAPEIAADMSVQIDRALAWRTGQIILDGDTLAAAAADFNRYNDRPIVIADEALAGQRLVGRFRTNEPDAFARAAAGMLGARVEISAEEIRLSRR